MEEVLAGTADYDQRYPSMQQAHQDLTDYRDGAFSYLLQYQPKEKTRRLPRSLSRHRAGKRFWPDVSMRFTSHMTGMNIRIQLRQERHRKMFCASCRNSWKIPSLCRKFTVI